MTGLRNNKKIKKINYFYSFDIKVITSKKQLLTSRSSGCGLRRITPHEPGVPGLPWTTPDYSDLLQITADYFRLPQITPDYQFVSPSGPADYQSCSPSVLERITVHYQFVSPSGRTDYQSCFSLGITRDYSDLLQITADYFRLPQITRITLD